MQTFVVILLGKHRKRVGYMAGDFKSREDQGIDKAMVWFQRDKKSGDGALIKLSSMRQATMLEQVIWEEGQNV